MTTASRRVPPASANGNTPLPPVLAARTPASLPPSNPWASVRPIEGKAVKDDIHARPLPIPDADAYAMTLRGDCLRPVVLDGSVAIISPLAPLVTLQLVALFFKDNRMPLVTRLIALPPDAILRALAPAQPGRNVVGVVLVEMLNPPSLLHFRLSDLAAIHAVVEVIPPDQVAARRRGAIDRGVGNQVAAGVTS